MEVGLGFVNNNQEIKYIFRLFCLGICCSHYFKQLDNVLNVVINLSLGCCVFVQYIAISEIVCVLKTVAIVTSEHLKLSMISVASQH